MCRQAVDVSKLGLGPELRGYGGASGTTPVTGQYITNLHHDHNGGQDRGCTLMIYLADVAPVCGGETVFPTATCVYEGDGPVDTCRTQEDPLSALLSGVSRDR